MVYREAVVRFAIRKNGDLYLLTEEHLFGLDKKLIIQKIEDMFFNNIRHKYVKIIKYKKAFDILTLHLKYKTFKKDYKDFYNVFEMLVLQDYVKFYKESFEEHFRFAYNPFKNKIVFLNKFAVEGAIKEDLVYCFKNLFAKTFKRDYNKAVAKIEKLFQEGKINKDKINVVDKRGVIVKKPADPLNVIDLIYPAAAAA